MDRLHASPSRPCAPAACEAQSPRSDIYHAPCVWSCSCAMLRGGRFKAESVRKTFFRLATGPPCAPAPLLLARLRFRGVTYTTHLVSGAAALQCCGGAGSRPRVSQRRAGQTCRKLRHLGARPPVRHGPWLPAWSWVPPRCSAWQRYLARIGSKGPGLIGFFGSLGAVRRVRPLCM